VSLALVAATAQEAERLATTQGMLVATVKPLATTDIGTDPLPIWDEDPAHPPPQVTRHPPSQGSGKPPASSPASSPAAPTTMAGANNDQDAAAQAHHAAQLHAQQAAVPASANYHVIQNPALYLLETAVNKHIKEGWEPLGGIQVNNWNNQMQFFQSLIRRNPGHG